MDSVMSGGKASVSPAEPMPTSGYGPDPIANGVVQPIWTPGVHGTTPGAH